MTDLITYFLLKVTSKSDGVDGSGVARVIRMGGTGDTSYNYMGEHINLIKKCSLLD